MTAPAPLGITGGRTMWTIFGVAALLALLAFWRGPNAVWGTLTFGVLVGLIWAAVAAVQGHGFQVAIILRGAIVGALVGGGLEALGKAGAALKARGRR